MSNFSLTDKTYLMGKQGNGGNGFTVKSDKFNLEAFIFCMSEDNRANIACSEIVFR